MAFFNLQAGVRCALIAAITLTAATQARSQLVDLKPLPREGGLSDLVILDPGTGTNDAGAPAVIYNDETQQVEVPPVLHIHRYYYSGDKEYQGPLMAGGPTVIVAQHPATGKQVYVDAMLPPGAPLITYTKTSISYIYQDKRVVVTFSHLLKERVKVAVIHGRGARRTVAEKTDAIVADVKKKSRRSRLVTSLKEAASSTKMRLKGAAGITHQVASFAVEKTGELVSVLPGAQLLESVGERADEAGAREEIRRAAFEQEAAGRVFIETIR